MPNELRRELDNILQILQTNELSLEWLEEQGFASAGVFWIYFFYLMEREEILFEIWNNPSKHTFNFKCSNTCEFEIGMGDMIQQLLQTMNGLV